MLNVPYCIARNYSANECSVRLHRLHTPAYLLFSQLGVVMPQWAELLMYTVVVYVRESFREITFRASMRLLKIMG